ncbi:hypothetical protein ACJJTC_013911 [Scirpophaga incertulas]
MRVGAPNRLASPSRALVLQPVDTCSLIGLCSRPRGIDGDGRVFVLTNYRKLFGTKIILSRDIGLYLHLSCDAIYKRKKYEEIKKDPEKYAAQKEKGRLRYLRRKEQKKLKTIDDLTPWQQRQKRKLWRESRHRYVEKKKKEKIVEQMLIDNSPPTSDEETLQVPQVDPLEVPLVSQSEVKTNEMKCANCVKKLKTIRHIRYMYTKRIGLLKQEIQKKENEKKEIQKLLNKIMRENKQYKKENPSTTEKIVNLIKNIDEGHKEIVKKKLIFSEVITKQLKEGYKKLRKTEKRKFSDTFVKNKEHFKKYRITFGRDIGTLKDFWLVIKEKIKNVEIRIVSKKDIEEKKTPRNLKSFKGTMSVHQVLWSANSLRMTFRKLSCFFCPNGVTCTHGYHLGYMNIHEDSMPHNQEDVLHDFLDENTTPEVIEEINNSPNKYFTNLNSFVYVQYSSPVTPKPSSSPKVKILSDVRLDWSNTSFNMKAPSYKQQRFQTDFEKFIASSEIPASSGSSELVFKTKKQTEDVHQNKENEVESDSDDEYYIFDYKKKTVKGKVIANKRLEKIIIHFKYNKVQIETKIHKNENHDPIK